MNGSPNGNGIWRVAPKFWRGRCCIEMRAMIVRLALKIPVRWRSEPKSARALRPIREGLNRVERMACFVAQHYTDQMTVQDILDHVRPHPNYAMNLS